MVFSVLVFCVNCSADLDWKNPCDGSRPAVRYSDLFQMSAKRYENSSTKLFASSPGAVLKWQKASWVAQSSLLTSWIENRCESVFRSRITFCFFSFFLVRYRSGVTYRATGRIQFLLQQKINEVLISIVQVEERIEFTKTIYVSPEKLPSLPWWHIHIKNWFHVCE